MTPTHWAHAIVVALAPAADDGFTLPVVWNCEGYESVGILRLLERMVGIYMPDLKYGNDAVALRLSGIPNCVAVSRAAVRGMHSQAGDLVIDRHGLAERGLLVRHLVLPNHLAGTETVARFVAEEVSADTNLNLMDPYHPAYLAARHPELACPLTIKGFATAEAAARHAALWRWAGEMGLPSSPESHARTLSRRRRRSVSLDLDIV